MSDTDSQLSDALTAQFVTFKAAIEAILNRVASIVTNEQLSRLEETAAIRQELAAIAAQLVVFQADLAAQQVREEAGHAALRGEVASLAAERRAVEDALSQSIAALTEDVAHLRERGA